MSELKRLFTLLAIVSQTAMIWAQGVSRDEALQIAERFFAQQPMPTETSAAKTNLRRNVQKEDMRVAFTATKDDGKDALYVINSGEDSGFVIVSTDDKTDHPVLGWSESGTFNYDKAPIQLKGLIEAYARSDWRTITSDGLSDSNVIRMADQRTAQLVKEGQKQVLLVLPQQSGKRAERHRVETVPNVVVQPLVKVQWNQVGEYAKYVDSYYDSFTGVAAGCVPTAMAQIMAFWKYPSRGRGFHLHNIIDVPAEINLNQLEIEYATGINKELENVIKQYSHPYKVNFSESVYQWNAMGEKYPTTDAEKDNVAKLIFDCHVSCSPTKLPNVRGTGANISAAASSLVRYFGYSPDMQYMACEGNEDLLRAELDAGRPILMDGYPHNGYDNEGHAFICDGYAADDYFHFNFGWSGEGNGYYKLSKVNPMTSDFSINQQAYIGIQPSLVAVESGQAFINVTPTGKGIVVGGYGNVVAPATVEKDGKSYPVVKVKSYAFNVPRSKYDVWFEQYIKEYVTAITLPESVTEIGTMAFPSPYLTEVNLPGNLRKIGANAFFHSRNLKKVSIPSIEAWLNIDFEPKTLENGFDQYLSNPIWSSDNTYTGRLCIDGQEVTDIVIPASIKEVRPAAFCGYQFLNSVTMEEGVEKIGANAFERVPLKKLCIASTVNEIGNKAFYQHKTSTITIPKGLTKVGSEALSGDYISEYIVDEDNPKYSAYQGILYDRSRRTLIHCPNFRPGFKEDKVRATVGVPSSVTSIRANSFGNNLKELTLPPSVKSIEEAAFAATENLKDLYVYTQSPLPITASTFHSNATSMFNKVKVHVPAGAAEAYRTAPVWQDMEIVEDHDAGSLPPENYDLTTDYNAIAILKSKQEGIFFPNGPIEYFYYLFNTQPVVTFSGKSLLLTTTKGNYTFELDNPLQIQFVHYDDPTGIDYVKTNELRVVFRVEGEQLVISGLDADTLITLYGLDGRMFVSGKAPAQGDFITNIPSAGTVIVKAGNHSFKIHSR